MECSTYGYSHVCLSFTSRQPCQVALVAVDGVAPRVGANGPGPPRTRVARGPVLAGTITEPKRCGKSVNHVVCNSSLSADACCCGRPSMLWSCPSRCSPPAGSTSRQRSSAECSRSSRLTSGVGGARPRPGAPTATAAQGKRVDSVTTDSGVVGAYHVSFVPRTAAAGLTERGTYPDL